MKLVKLTEEEIKKLPYPDTARAIGGVLVPKYNNMSDADIAQFKKMWHEHTKQNNGKEFKTPIIRGE